MDTFLESSAKIEAVCCVKWATLVHSDLDGRSSLCFIFFQFGVSGILKKGFYNRKSSQYAH